MLIGAKQAGFSILGNMEERKDFHTGTFEANFKGAYFMNALPPLDAMNLPDYKGIDLVMAHPACGAFSNLKNTKEEASDAKMEDLLRTLRLVKKVAPRFFVIDNLPKLLESLDGKWWAIKFPEYDIFIEYVHNYHYGSSQKNRSRVFIIAAKKKEKFVFVPGEVETNTTVKDVIGDLHNKGYGKIPNHDKHTLKEKCAKGFGLHKKMVRYTWKDARDYFKKEKDGHNLVYHARDGKIKSRFGFRKSHWDGPCGTLIGKNATVHPKTNLPFSIRERARLQGAPDDFVFVGSILNKDGTWNHDRNLAMTRQTGRFIPVEFCRYVSKLIMAHIKSKKIKVSGERVGKPNDLITENKKLYCATRKKETRKTCAQCWVKDCKRRK
jgi:DNA (cytosine-5)-methyltransferase 1